MNSKNLVFLMYVVSAALLLFCTPSVFADDLDFAVIQPGQPGTPEEARPVMDALAAYVQKKLGTDDVAKGVYFNALDPALDFLHNERPTWGIVGIGFYSEYAADIEMTAFAATRPGGRDKDLWRLVVSEKGTAKWQALKGTVSGNMLFEKDAAACLLFNRPAHRLPFDLKGTFHPLRSLRSVIRGKAAGAVLDRPQYEAVQALSLAKEIAVAHTSGELPTSPVVWFGKTDSKTRELAAVLLQMKKDQDAQALLKLLQTDGFGTADPDLPQFKRGRDKTVCFP